VRFLDEEGTVVGLFGRKRKDLAIEGLPGKATIMASELITKWGERSDEVNPLAEEFGIGSVPYKLSLAIQLDDGRKPYTVVGKFRVPVKHDLADVGMVIPLRADPDDPQKIELDWQTADTVEGVNPALDKARHAVTHAGIYENFPAASRAQMIDGWVGAANGGQMSREQFDTAIDEAVAAGMLNDDDAAKARAALK
jgi:hypothetical protein